MNMRLMSVALGTLSLLLWGLILRRRWSDRPGIILAGAFAGLGVGVRLLYLPWAGMLGLIVGWLCLRGMKKEVRLGNMFAYFGGLLAGLAPSAALLVRDADRFLFNNLRYHQLRFSSREAVGTADTPEAVLALQAVGKALFLNPFMVLQLVLVGFGIDWARRHPDSPLRPLLILSGAGAVVHTVVCLVRLIDLVKKPRLVLASALGLAAVLSVVDLQVRKTGMDWNEVWSFEHLAKVSAGIEAHSEPDDMVMAFWPGYVFETGRQFLPGLENQFTIGVSEKLTIEQKIHDHVAGKELMIKAFEEQIPEQVVLGAWMHELNTTIEQRHLPILLEELTDKYELVEVFGESKVMVRKTAVR